MAEDNSQNPQNSKKKLFSDLFKRSASDPPGSSQRHSVRRWIRSKLNKPTPSLTQAESSLTETPGGNIPSDLSAVAPDITSPDPSLSTGDPAHRATTASSEVDSLAISSQVENPPNLSPVHESTQTGELSSGVPGQASDSNEIQDSTQPGDDDAESPLKKNLKLTGRALQTLLTKAATIADTNPIKVALGLVKVIVEIKNAVRDNKDAVTQHITATGSRLEEVERALDGWKPVGEQGTSFIDRFNDALMGELKKLKDLNDEHMLQKILDYEDEQVRIKDIFTRINDAREKFDLVLRVKVFKAVSQIGQVIEGQSLGLLKPLHVANYDYSGSEGRKLRRQPCIKGTRVRILGEIVTWANDVSLECPNVYWLFGHAGSGKSTIAYTIAHRFEFASDSDDVIILGGNFFCSRLFSETSDSVHIIRTIVYYLALKCKPFSDVLPYREIDSIITRKPDYQLKHLLFGPWQQSQAARLKDVSVPLHYLFVIDALDEIEREGGSEFLHALVTTINKISKESLNGLKFFVTSRSDPGLAEFVESLEQKQLYCLQDVQQAEAYADVAIYLHASLPHLIGHQQMEQLEKQAAGLFIYASTVVKYLEKYDSAEHLECLQTLFIQDSNILQNSEDTLLDILYHQILTEASSHSKSRYYLDILHAILCSAEPTSNLVITQLLSLAAPTIVDKVFKSLHALLYTEKDNILSYHKSFPDFIFDQARSKGFWCNKAAYHQKLAISCFNIMGGLHFNLANIPSSYIFDSENDTLADGVKQNISPGLSYACCSWDHHLSATESPLSDMLLGILSDFLKLKALFWIEAMNLLGQCAHCYPMFQTVHDLVTKSKAKSPLPENLAEAGFFAQYFSTGSAWKSTPHLYISTLATWPRNSDPIQTWKSYFPRIPKFTNASTGGTLLMSLHVGSVIYSIAFSSNGHYIASGSEDHLVRVWNALNGQEKYVLSGHTDVVRSVAFSNNGCNIVSGSDDSSVRVWDALTCEEKHVLDGHTAQVYSVAFSSDSCYIVSGSEDKSICLWNALTGQKEHVLNGHTAAVFSVAFSDDCGYIVSGSEDKSIRIWSTLTGLENLVLNGHMAQVFCVAFSHDGIQIVSCSDDKTIRVWDTIQGLEKLVLNVHTARVYSVAFTSDNRHIVSGSRDHSVRVSDAFTGQQKHILEGHTNSVTSVVFSSDFSRIVSGSHDGSIRVWGTLTDQEKHTPNGHTARVPSVAFSSDGTLIVSGSDDKTVRVWDAMNGQQKLALRHPDKVYSVAFSPNGRHIVSGSPDKLIRVWNALSGQKELDLIGHTDEVNSVVFSSDSRYIVSGSDDASVRVWDVLTGQEKYALNGHMELVRSVAFSNNGSYIASGSDDRSVKVWDALTGQEMHELHGHTADINSVAFSIDSKFIVSASDDESISVWDASTGQERYVLNGHTAQVYTATFSHDGCYIVSGSSDKSIQVWDVLTGQAKHVLHGHKRGVLSVAFSMDSTQIVSGSADRTVQVWVNPVHYQPRYTQEKIVTSAGHLEPSGWLLSQNGNEYLMFVPPGVALPDDTHLLSIPSSHASYVNFIGSKMGLEWKKCSCL